jgi:hypothetical protein
MCGIEVSSNTNLKRFGKLFCSDEHMNQYVKARQQKLRLIQEAGGHDEDEYGTERRKSRFRWGGCG